MLDHTSFDAAVRVLADLAAPLAATALRASAVLAIVWGAQRALGSRTSASARHAAWVAAVAVVLALPLAELPAVRAAAPDAVQVRWSPAAGSPAASVPARPHPAPTTAAPTPAAVTGASQPASRSVSRAPARSGPSRRPGAPLATPLPPRPAPSLLLLAGLVTAWAIGATLALVRLGLSALSATRHVRRCVSDRALSAAVGYAVRRSPGGTVPYVWGLVRPTVVVPDGFDAWPEPARRAALVHEVAHARRRDALTGVLARSVRALHWFNPLVYLAVQRLDRERERAADDAVLAAGAAPVDYAGLLVHAARRSLTGSPALAPAHTSPSSGRFALDERVRALLDATTRRGRPGRAATLAGCAALLLAAVSLSAFGVSVDRLPATPRLPATLEVSPESTPADSVNVPGWYVPPPTAQRWAPELHSADGWTYTPTFTPDLRTAYYVLWHAPDYRRPAASIQELYTVRWSDADRAWSRPERVAALAGWRVDWPHVSPDGRRLFLSTTKPHPGHYGYADGRTLPPRTADFDLWAADLGAGGAIDGPTLAQLDSPDLNRQKTTENARTGYVHNETAPRTDRAGRLYFWTERLDDGGGRRDVYVAEPDGAGGWQRPTLMPFNTARQESGVAADPEGRWLVFASEGRGGLGGADLFLTVRDGDGWTEPVNLGPTVNSHARDDSPEVSPDGRTLFFSSNRPGPGVPTVDAGEGTGPAASVYWVDLHAVPTFTEALGARPAR